MSYTSLAEMETAFGSREVLDLSDRDLDGVSDAGVVDAAVADADDLINSYLRSRFDLPLVEVPGLIKKCARFIVRYSLSEDHATDRIKDDYKQALRWLSDARDGKMDLGITASGSAVESVTGGPDHHAGREAFPRDGLDAWTGGS